MRVRVRLLVVVTTVLAFVPAVWAVIGTIDQVPGATLLFPQLEVDADDPNGVTTLIAIQNASATAILARVTLWTDLGIPTAGFDVYLTGYDTQTINLRDVMVRGVLPATASAGQDPADMISPKGLYSQDINFASCGGDPDDFGAGDDGPLEPPLPPGTLSSSSVADLVALHSGGPSNGELGSVAAGRCAAVERGDGILRGYLTVDTMNQCSRMLPTDPNYFLNAITYQNVLLGDYFIVDPSNNFMVADAAVHIEASSTDPLTSWVPDGPPKYTFYGRLPTVNGSARDGREPLPTAWAVSAMAERQGLHYWRDPGVDVQPFTCGTLPDPFALDQTSVVLFDTEENATPVAAPSLFPYGVGETSMGGAAPTLPVTGKQGWVFLNLNAPEASGLFGRIRQSWVTGATTASDNGRFTARWGAVQLGNAAFADDPAPAAP